MTTYKFKCVKCKEVFSVEKEEKDVKKVQPKIFCPSCGAKGIDGDLEHQMIVSSSKQSRESLGKENAEKSMMAMEMKAQAEMAQDPRETEEVTVKSPDGGKSIKVPKVVVESIQDKLLSK